MKHKFDFINLELEEAKRNNLYRELKYGSISGSQIKINSKSLLNLCSNDYLGMPASILDIRQLQSSSRLVSGNDDSYMILEKKLARHKSYEGSLVYPTGYMANLGVISALVRKGDVIFSDELNHASIVEACKLSGAKIFVYKHNDMDDLASKLETKAGRKFIITEGVFSMDGDYAKLRQITELAQKFDAITILDDAHGDFVVGKDGRGTPNKFHTVEKIDVYISSLSKALGSFGGYVSSNNEVIDLCINKSKSFIYTSALPAHLVEYSLLRLNAEREKYRQKLFFNTRKFSAGLRDIGYTIESNTHIIPIILGDENIALELSNFLYKHGIFAQAIRYPTVPKSMARLRISITGWLSNQEIDDAISVFEMSAKRFKI